MSITHYACWPSLSKWEVMSPCSHWVHSRSSGVETLSYISGVMSGAWSSASSWSRGTSLSGRFDRVRQATRLSFGSPPPPVLRAFSRQTDTLNLERETNSMLRDFLCLCDSVPGKAPCREDWVQVLYPQHGVSQWRGQGPWGIVRGHRIEEVGQGDP